MSQNVKIMWIFESSFQFNKVFINMIFVHKVMPILLDTALVHTVYAPKLLDV